MFRWVEGHMCRVQGLPDVFLHVGFEVLVCQGFDYLAAVIVSLKDLYWDKWKKMKPNLSRDRYLGVLTPSRGRESTTMTFQAGRLGGGLSLRSFH